MCEAGRSCTLRAGIGDARRSAARAADFGLGIALLGGMATSGAATHEIAFLTEHHQRLERRFEELVERLRAGDPIALREEWFVFETDLLDHLAEEELEVLPDFQRLHPEEAEAIRAEHEGIRQALFEMSINLDLHLLRAETVEAFVAKLRDHARREEAVLYPWAASKVDPVGLRRLFEVA
jgi:hemerythrin-like domain-containing protein